MPATGGSNGGGAGGGQPAGLGGGVQGGWSGMGGAAGQAAGSGGTAGSRGSAGVGGQGGGTGQICSFAIQDSLSPAIPTVGVVDWSTDLAGLSDARIEFALNDPASTELSRGSGGPIDVTGQTHRALLLGLKPGRPYTYRIIARSGNTTCTSADRSLTTGAATNAPTFTIMITRATPSPAQGFIITTNYSNIAYIFDTDGAIVWWATAPGSPSRARMDWEGANMWMLSADGNQGGGDGVRRVSMDGTEVADVTGLPQAHHDLAVAPGGVIATLLWTGESSQASNLVERAPDGTIKTMAKLADVFPKVSPYHANSLAYHVWDDSYTVGDINGGGYVKLSRAGKLLWQFLAACATGSGAKCAAGALNGNHGHHLLQDGTFLFFNARLDPSPVYAYSLTETASALSATELWSYAPNAGTWTAAMGDIQLLPSGNALVDYSLSGEMREITPTGDVVQTITPLSQSGVKGEFGYADFRETLYGPPPR